MEKHGFTFMFVRHPMERLLSGYIEKIFERPPHREQDKGVNKIRKALGREKDVGRLQMAFSQSLSLSKDNASDQMTATKELAENDEESMPIMMTFNAFLHKILSIGNDHGIPLLTSSRPLCIISPLFRSRLSSSLGVFLVNLLSM